MTFMQSSFQQIHDGVECSMVPITLCVFSFQTELWWRGVPYDTCHTCMYFSFQQNHDGVECLMIPITPVCVFLSNRIMVVWSTLRYPSHLYVLFFKQNYGGVGCLMMSYHTCMCFSFQQNYGVEYFLVHITPACVFLFNRIMMTWNTLWYLSHLYMFFFRTELWWHGIPYDTYHTYICFSF